MAYDVFISHSNVDKVIADAVCAELEQNHIRCWIAPRDIRPGAEWGESIVEAIHGCRVMVLVFSSSANASPQIRREVERAVNKGVIVVPFRIEDVLPTRSLEYFIGAVHWLDALTPPIEQHVKSLASSVRRILGEEGSEDAAPMPIESRKAAAVMVPIQQADSSGARTPASDGVEPATNGKAIGSLVCGLLSIFPPAAVAAVILGHLSRGEILRSKGKLKGEKMALAGLILGYAGIVLLPLLIVAAIAIPNFVHARAAADEASASATLRTISTAAVAYQTDYGKLPPDLKSMGPKAAGSNASERAADLIDAETAAGVKSGYKFTYAVESDPSNFKIEATPLEPGKTGLRSMWVDQSGQVQFSYTPPSP